MPWEVEDMALKSWRGFILGFCLAVIGCSPVGYIVAATAMGASGGGSGGTGQKARLRVTLGPGSPSSTDALPNETRVEALQISLEAIHRPVDVSSITFRATGTGNDQSGLVAVDLYVDTNGNGTYEPSTDTPQLGSALGFSGDDGEVGFLALSQTIPVGGRVDWILVYDFGDTPVPGETFCVEVSDPAAVGASSGGKAAGVDVQSGIQGCVTMVTGSLTISVGPASPPAGTMGQCAVGQVLLQVELAAAPEEDISVSSVTFTASGTGDDLGDIAAAELYIDSNGDGVLDGSDTPLGVPEAYSGDNGTVTFSSLGGSIPGGGSQRWILVYDLVPGVASGASFAADLASGGDVTATGQTSLKALPVAGTPVPGNLVTVDDPRLVSATFVDVNADGVLDVGDAVTLGFDQEVVVQATPLADAVFALDPPGSFGGSAIVASGGQASEVVITSQAGASLQPNGVFGTDPGSSGVNVVNGQTGLANCNSSVLAVPLLTPLEIEGTLNPRVTGVSYRDWNINCVLDAGDMVEVSFTTVVDLATADPVLAFQLPVLNDSFGAGARFQGGGTPVGVSFLRIELGPGPVLQPVGAFDGVSLTPGSPSGIDVLDTSGMIVDSAYPAVSALPRPIPGVDVAEAPVCPWYKDGEQLEDFFGCSVASAGDVNGDGFQDIIVGAYAHQTSITGAGKAYVFPGEPGGVSTTPIWTSQGDNIVNTWFGYSVAGAGDVNGDGWDDIIVGAQRDPGVNQGKVFLYLGSPSGPASSPVWTYNGPSGGYLGSSVASLGDVNGDTRADVILGAPGGNGIAYAFFGDASTGLSLGPDWSSTGDDQANAAFGSCVASAGDVNNDGYPEAIVGAPAQASDDGAAFLYHGGPSGLSPTADWTFYGIFNEELGTSVASAGDVNGDTFDDVIIGSPRGGPSYQGAAYIWAGSATGLGTSGPSWYPRSDDPIGSRESFGATVSSAGDIDGDGFADVMVGDPMTDLTGPTRLNAGVVFVYLGGSGGLMGSPVWYSTGDGVTNGRFSAAMASSGDINGDGLSEIIVGQPGATGFSWIGHAFVYCIPP